MFWSLGFGLSMTFSYLKQQHQHCFGCMHCVTILLKGEPLPHSEVVWSLEQFFFFFFCKNLSLFGCILLSCNTFSLCTSEKQLITWCCHHHASSFWHGVSEFMHHSFFFCQTWQLEAIFIFVWVLFLMISESFKCQPLVDWVFLLSLMRNPCSVGVAKIPLT